MFDPTNCTNWGESASIKTKKRKKSVNKLQKFKKLEMPLGKKNNTYNNEGQTTKNKKS
jgi:uncharacterized protein YjcR